MYNEQWLNATYSYLCIASLINQAYINNSYKPFDICSRSNFLVYRVTKLVKNNFITIQWYCKLQFVIQIIYPLQWPQLLEQQLQDHTTVIWLSYEQKPKIFLWLFVRVIFNYLYHFLSEWSSNKLYQVNLDEWQRLLKKYMPPNDDM